MALREKAPESNVVRIFAMLGAIFFFISVFIFCAFPAGAQTADFPEPLKPVNNATGLSTTDIVFTWSPYYVGTEQYTLQIATDTGFEETDIVFETVVAGTTYSYKATTLSNDTTYWWRVMASKPVGGTWSPVYRFITESEPLPPPTQPEQADNSFFTSIKDFFTGADPLLLGLIAAGIIVVVLAVYVIFIQPASKKNIPPSSHQASAPISGGPTQQGRHCPQCGTANPPGKKFCGRCGANLAPPPPPPPPPTSSWAQQQQQSGLNNCPSCGSVNPPERGFCGNCGTNLAATPEPAPAQPQERFCTSCGTQNPADKKFCGNCGTNLAAATEPAPPTPQERFCTSCGTQNPADKKFCGNCGASLEAGVAQQQFQIGQSYSCPICGGPVTPGTNPCASCGTWLDWS